MRRWVVQAHLSYLSSSGSAELIQITGNQLYRLGNFNQVVFVEVKWSTNSVLVDNALSEVG